MVDTWLPDWHAKRGALYLLDRGGFEAVLAGDGHPRAEWVCPHPVVPVAAITVTPADFPYLDQVGGHDASAAFAFVDRLERLVRDALEVRAISGGWQLSFSSDPATAAALASLVALTDTTVVVADLTVVVTVRSMHGGATVDLIGSPLISKAVEHWRSTPADRDE